MNSGALLEAANELMISVHDRTAIQALLVQKGVDGWTISKQHQSQQCVLCVMSTVVSHGAELDLFGTSQRCLQDGS